MRLGESYVILQILGLFLLVIGSAVAIWLGWRLYSSRASLPCPASLSWLLDNPLTRSYRRTVLSRLDIFPGLVVLDAGCGPGLFTTALAERVGPTGAVVALDIQPGMLEKARARASSSGLANIRFLLAGLGEGKLPSSQFDLAILVTVLGEIPDRQAALAEIRNSLKPGGSVFITEVLPDPHYQSSRVVVRLAQEVGLLPDRSYGNVFFYTLKLSKPAGA